MTERKGRPWLNYALGLVCLGAIVAAVLVVGPASGSTTTATRTAKAAEGVVQSTVSGSGNLAPASQLNLGFKTSGTVTNIYATQGQYVTQGKLLATLDPRSAEVTLEQAKATLQAAEASLAREEETDGEGSGGSGTSGSGAGGSGAGGGASAAAASVRDASAAAIASDATTTPASATTPAGASPNSPSATTPTATMPTATTPTVTTPSTTTPASTAPASTAPTSATTPTSAGAPKRIAPTHTAPSASKKAGGESEQRTSSGSSSSGSTLSAATREANIASARAAVKSGKLTVQSDEEAVQDTKLYAPEDGTIVSLSGQVGEVVSASGTTKTSSGSGASSSSGSGASATGASAAGRTGAGASGSGSSGSGSSGSGSSSAAFAVLSDLSSMQLVVALSESEISHVKVGQIATVTVEALEGRKLAAHVSEVAILSTSSSGVVSYDVTFQLDQMTAGLKPGMSATAEVVVKQAEGVNVPTSAISGGAVTVVRNGKDVRQRVVTGLAGDSSTIVLSGLEAGETVVLPQASSTSSSAASLTSRLRGRLGGGGLGGGALGGGGGFPGGGGAVLFRGGG